jgi:hypothetical protein
MNPTDFPLCVNLCCRHFDAGDAGGDRCRHLRLAHASFFAELFDPALTARCEFQFDSCCLRPSGYRVSTHLYFVFE